MKNHKRKAVFCTPCLERPRKAFLDAVEAAVPALDASGWDHGMVFEVGNAYVSGARANLLRKALNVSPDVIVFLDYDVSFGPDDLLKLLESEGDIVAGTYRYKTDDEEYMGMPEWDDVGRPAVCSRGRIGMHAIPAGFLKITRAAVNKFMAAYPELVYGEPCHPHVDLFNHGAIDRVWFGEDYAFALRWRRMGETVWCLPDLNITHHSAEKAFPGNYHDYLCRLPGGSKDPANVSRETMRTE